jgi:hypothetical protein
MVQGTIEVLERQFLALGDLEEQLIMVALLHLVASAQVEECLLSPRLVVVVVPGVEVLSDLKYILDLTGGVGPHNEGMRQVLEDQRRRMECHHSRSEPTFFKIR